MSPIAPGIFTIDGFFSTEECRIHVRATEAKGYEAATINTRKGALADPDVRNNSRLIVDDPDLAATLWQRLQPSVPGFISGRQAIGLNERFRFYRYASSERFSGHSDAPYERENGEKSLLTFMVYLNHDFSGGETAFQNATIKPETGLALLFRHELFHEGCPVISGTKYVLRSDVMFGRPGEITG
jgi:hypothetical protein